MAASFAGFVKIKKWKMPRAFARGILFTCALKGCRTKETTFEGVPYLGTFHVRFERFPFKGR